MLALVLLVDAGAIAVSVARFASATFTTSDLARIGLLCSLATCYATVCRRLDRVKRSLARPDSAMDSLGVWCFASAIALPPASAILVTLVVASGPQFINRRRPDAPHAHQALFTTATVILAVVGADTILDLGSSHDVHLGSGAFGALSVLLALSAYILINHGLVTAVVYLATPHPVQIRDILGSRDELLFEILTLLCGVFTGQTIVMSPWLTPTVLALIVVLHRSSLATQFERAASTDGKTGLLNAITWQELARRQLIRSEREGRAASVLLVDLDYFKLVNDVHGHQAGDIALKVVADALKAELRGYDGVGRYGGEEFVAFLDGADVATAGHAAERINQRIRDLRITLADGSELTVTASIGTASFPGDGLELDDLIAGADSALYAAKEAGRDCVRHFSDPRDGRRASVHQH